LSNSAAKYDVEPSAETPMLKGLAFAAVTRSAIEAMPALALAARTSGLRTTRLIGTRSLSGS
jgi:hypothetical protein